MSRLLTFLADVHARGLRVLEHPLYGGVHPVHMSGSYHYKGRAADINYGPPGAPPEERAVLLWACRLADAAGLNVIYAYHRTHPIATTNANHRDHMHVDDGPIRAYVPPGRNDALYARILAEHPRLVSNPVGSTGGTGIPTPGGSLPEPLEEIDMTPEQDAMLRAIATNFPDRVTDGESKVSLIQAMNRAMPILRANYDAVRSLQATVTAQAATIQVLASSAGIDPTKIAASIEAAVKKALAGTTTTATITFPTED